MGDNAGSVYAEIRIALEKLQGDLSKVDGMFGKLEEGIDNSNKRIPIGFKKTTKEITNEFNKLSNTAVGQFAQMAKKIQGAFMALPIIGFVTMIVGAIKKIINGIGDFLNKTTDAYHNQQKELMTLNTILNTTGANAWITAGQLEVMAKTISRETGNSINDINKMHTRLLTYTNIIGDNFNRASQAAIDMAAVMGTDLSSAAETLGKALDSPVEGLTALTKQGFGFKGEIKEQIALLTEQGRIAEAQALILADVESAYGGAARAIENSTGNSTRLKNITEELNAEIGKYTSGITNWFRGINLVSKETRLMEIRQKNLVNDIKTTNATIAELTNQIRDLEQQSRISGDSTGGLANQINNLMVAREAIENIDHLNNQIDLLGIKASRMEGMFDPDQVQRYLNPLNILRDVWFSIQSIASGDTSATKLREQMAALSPIVERYEELNRQTAKRIELERASDSANLEFRNHVDAVNAAIRKREAILKDIQQQQNDGQIDFDEAQKRRQAAYNEEINTIFSAGRSLEEMQEKLNETRIRQIEDVEIIAGKTNNALKKLYEANLLEVDDYNRRVALNIQTTSDLIANINKRYNEQEAAIKNANQARSNAIIQERAINNQRLRAAANEKAAQEKTTHANEVRRKQLQDIIDMQNTSDSARQQAVKDLLVHEQNIAEAQLRQQDYFKNLTAGLGRNTEAYRNAVALQNQLIAQARDMVALKISTEIPAQQEIYDNNMQLKLLEAERIGDIKTMLELERQIALEKLQQSDIYLNASEATQAQLRAQIGLLDQASAINEYTEYTADTERQIALQLAKNINNKKEIRRIELEILKINLQQQDFWKYLTEEQQREAIANMEALYDSQNKVGSTFLKDFQTVAGEIENIIGAIGSLITETMKKELDQRLTDLDEFYNGDEGLFKMLENELQARLYAMGFVDAKTKEQHEKELEDAKKSGNQRRIFEAQSALERFKIEEEYAIEKKRLEDELRDKKAKEEFRFAMAQWHIQMAQAAISAAQGILNVIASSPAATWPFLIPTATAIGGINIATIATNKPVQTFSNGGIVMGESLTGDRTWTRQNHREMDLTLEHQKNLFDAIDKNELGGETTVVIPVYLDGMLITKVVVNNINNRQALIKQGSVVK